MFEVVINWFASMTHYEAIGWVGLTIFLVAYHLVANKKVDSAGVVYNTMNVVGAIAIACSLIPLQAWPTIALEACFVLIGLRMIYAKLASKFIFAAGVGLVVHGIISAVIVKQTGLMEWAQESLFRSLVLLICWWGPMVVWIASVAMRFLPNKAYWQDHQS